MASVIRTFQPVIEEQLDRQIFESRLRMSPFFNRVFPDTSSIQRDEVSENWVKRHIFTKGLAGAGQYQDIAPGNSFLATSDTGTPSFNILGDTSYFQYLTPNQATNPGYFNWVVRLLGYKGEMFINNELLRMDKLPANVAPLISRIVTQTAKRQAYNMVNAFWAQSIPSAATGAATLHGVVGAYQNSSGSDVTIEPSTSRVSGNLQLTQSSSIRRFENGMSLDVWFDSGSDTFTKLNQDYDLFVSHKDVYSRSLRLVTNKSAASGTGDNTVFSNGQTYYFTLKGAYPGITVTSSTNPTLPFSLERVIKSTGYIFGVDNTSSNRWDLGINLAHHPEFRSYVSAVGSALDEQTLMLHMTNQQEATDGNDGIDTLIAREGVWVAFRASVDALHVYQRQNQPMEIRGGVREPAPGVFLKWEGFGRTIDCMRDSWATPNTVWGVKTSERNWKILGPPRVPGASKPNEFPAAVEFMGPVYGSTSIWMPYFDPTTGNLTNMMRAPFEMPHQYCPDYIPGMKLTSVLEQRASLQAIPS